MISMLYSLESNLRDSGASYTEIAKERQEKAIPIMDAMEVWMQESSKKTTPSDKLGEAIDYSFKL